MKAVITTFYKWQNTDAENTDQSYTVSLGTQKPYSRVLTWSSCILISSQLGPLENVSCYIDTKFIKNKTQGLN